jgi:hypothetical protein
MENKATIESATPKSTQQSERSSDGCCGGAAPEGVDACCVLDAEVKAEGGAGCGCSTSAAPLKKSCC